MDFLPMVPASCSLDEDALSRQLSRYRAAGDGARVIEQSNQRLVIRVGEQVSAAVIEELVAVEQGCCPFFDLRWEPESRALTVAVSRPEDEPGLSAIKHAVGVAR